MNKARRAAERRREREQARGVDPNAQTKAGIDATDPNRGDIDPKAATALHDGPAQRGELEFDDGLTDDTSRLGDVAEVTVLRDRPPAPTRRGGILQVREGQNAGQRLPLKTTPTLIGRASWAQLQLDDPTLSREHLELRFISADGTWLVQDLDSTSGTLLNGVELTMSTQIKHGDLLSFGSNETRFVWSANEPEEAAPPQDKREKTKTRTKLAEASKTRTRTRMPQRPKPAKEGGGNLGLVVGVAVAAAVLVAAIAAAGYFWFIHGQTDDTHLNVLVESHVKEAQRLIADGELPEAKQRLDAALGLRPEHALAKSLQRTVDSDLEAYEALREARELFDAGKTEEALKALLRIPDSSRFAKERERIRARAAEKARKASVRRIEQRIEDGLLDEAEEQLQKHLSRWPKDAFAQGMTDRITAIREAPPPENPVITRARDAFAAGEPIKARIVVEADAARGSGVAERYLKDLDRFEAAASRGKRKLASKDKSALVDLEEAWSLVPRLGRGRKGGVAASLKRPLADALFLEAVSARTSKRECDWARSILRASALRPTDQKISAQRRQVDAKASAALTRARARNMTDPTEAQGLARAGLCLAPPGSRTYKALRKLTR